MKFKVIAVERNDGTKDYTLKWRHEFSDRKYHPKILAQLFFLDLMPFYPNERIGFKSLDDVSVAIDKIIKEDREWFYSKQKRTKTIKTMSL